MYADMIDSIGFLREIDPALSEAMGRELRRQRENIELIASENIVSPA
ncbi:MAG: serine hydroxymethyltransferase, partial [Oscillospiraceae bacterium]|nr:serine hydroxymethyltransferase [Oscillospiraceae bacterium]